MKKLLFLVIVWPAIAFSQNFIENGSLEFWDDMLLTPLDWSIEGNVSEDNTEFTNGGSSALLINGTTGPKLTATNYNLEVGKTYQLSFDYKVKTANPSFGQQVIGYAYGGADFTPNSNRSRIPQNFNWNTVTTELIPTNTESWYLEISLFSFIADAFEVYIDNVQVIETGTTTQRDALIAIYNATNGDNWYNSWNIDEDMSTWNGVTLDASGNVIELDLSSNGLEGNIPSEIENLTSLSTLNLNRNSLSGNIPSGIKNIGTLTSFNIGDNRFVFEDFEDDFNTYNALSSFTYSPQAWLEEPIQIEMTLGNNYTFSATGTQSVNNIYNWVKGSSFITGQNDPSLTLTNVSAADADVYYCQINNTNVPGLSLTAAYTSLTAPVPQIQKDALIALYNDTDGANWTNTWDLSTNIGTWYGVFLDTSGNIRQLSLRENGLKGTIPNEIGNFPGLISLWLGKNELTGTIPVTIGNLNNLSSIILDSNQLSGEIPKEIGNLTLLNWLILVDNQLSGPIPIEIGNLTQLELLQIEKNQLIGSIPAEIGNLSNLTDLDVSYNLLENEIPKEIGNLSKLLVLDLQHNKLEGSIPTEVGNLTSLSTFRLNNNQLSGAIPTGIKDIASLQVFDIYDNKFVFEDFENDFTSYNSLSSFNYAWQDKIDEPTSIDLVEGGQITITVLGTQSPNNLYQWRKNGANLAGENNATLTITNASAADGGFYDCLITNTIIPGLTIVKNNVSVINSTVKAQKDALIALYNATDGPNWTTTWDLNANMSTWHGVALDASLNVIGLYLDNNNLNGTLPTQLGDLSSLSNLSLNSNQLSGTIPNEIGNLTELAGLSLSGNSLSGNIPNEIQNLLKLQTFIADGNELNGAIPVEIGNLTDLRSLDLSSNEFTGTIPSILGALTNLVSLEINSNQLEGTIPTEIWNLTNLQSLQLNNNQITGEIPTEIENLTNLVLLYLAGNNLDGEIPSEIGNLSSLTDLSLSNNDFSGSIPIEIGNLSNLTSLELSHNTFTGSIPSEIGNLTKLRYLGMLRAGISGNIPTSIGNLTSLTLLRLDGNNLEGGIPSEITNLVNLQSLLLGSNNLSGTIPNTIGNMVSLESIYIDSNELTGSIPASITNLTNLKILSLGNNNLEGPIPNLTSLPLETLSINFNSFVFEDFEANFTYYISNLNTFNYKYQNGFDDELTLTPTERSNINLSVEGTQSPNNNYQWRKDGNNIPNANNRILTISNVSADDMGEYTCWVTNSIVTDMTISRKPITVNVQFLDDDNDGVTNDKDQCSNTPTGETVDGNGCSESQLDNDNDGVLNNIDLCSDTPIGESVDTNGCSQSQLDDDNDGVTNDKDLCPNTPAGEIADQNGCGTSELSDIEPGDITLIVTSTSCPDVDNGEVSLSFKKNHLYEISISSDTENRTYNNFNFNDGFIIPNLAPGTYEVCVTASDIPRFSQCYTAIIERTESLKVSEINTDSKVATYKLSGSKYYNVTINSKNYEFNFEDTLEKEVTLELEKGSNLIEIKTDKECQGTFKKNVIGDGIIVYPLPAGDYINIAGVTEGKISINIRNINGRTVFMSSVNNVNNEHQIPLHNLSTGIYLLSITTPSQTINTKIFKK